MNRIGVFALLAAMTATAAYAQQRYDPAIPRGASEQRVEPAGQLAQPGPASVPPRLVQNQRRSMRDADARHCLDQATTNRQIHRCSLKYRSHASRASSVKRVSAKPPAAAPAPAASIEMTRPPADMKPGAPRPGDAAKAAELVKPMDVTKSAAPPVKPAAPTAPPPPPAKAPEPAKK